MLYLDIDAALAEVPVNVVPLTDDTDFKSTEEAIAYNAAGMDLEFHFTDTAGNTTVTAVTPTTGGGDYDWTHQGNGMYTIKIPASGGASINNDTEGFGRFIGKVTGVLSFASPLLCFRASGINDKLVDSAYDSARGLSGTALPNAASGSAGGLPVSDAGGLDLDAKLANTNEITAARMGALTDWINGGRLDLILDGIASLVTSIFSQNATIGADTANILTGLSDIKGTSFVKDTHSLKQIRDDTNELQGDLADDGRLDLLIDAIKAKTDNLPADTATTLATLATAAKLLKYIQLLARSDSAIATDNSTELGEINADGGSGAGDYSPPADSLEASQAEHDATQAAVAGIEGGAGGANTVTITVDDDSDNLIANAVVLLYSGVTLIDRQVTNGSGVATLTADNGTYRRIVYVPTGGYSSSDVASFTVSGDTAASVELTAHSVASTVPSSVTGQYTVYVDGVATSGISVTCKPYKRPQSSGDDNYTGVMDLRSQTGTTNGSGVVQFANLFNGVTYQITAGGVTVLTTIPNGSTGTVNLNTLVSEETS